MRTRCAAAAAVVPVVLVLFMTVGGPAARADPIVPTTLTLVRQPPDYPAVFHDRIDHGPSSLPGVDVVDYQATLSADGVGVVGEPVVLQRMLAGQSTWHAVGAA